MPPGDPHRVVDLDRLCRARARPFRGRVVRRRPAADRDEQLVGLSRLAVLQLDAAPARPAHRGRLRVRCAVDAPLPRSASATCSLANGSSRAIRPLAGLDQRHVRAERAPRLRQLDADDPAAEDDSRRGPSRRSSPRGSSTAATSAEPVIGGIAAPEPVATTTASAASSPSLADRPAARRRAGRGRGTARCRAPRARQLAESSSSWITSSRRARAGLGVQPPVTASARRAPARLGEQLAGRSSAFDGMQA